MWIEGSVSKFLKSNFDTLVDRCATDSSMHAIIFVLSLNYENQN